MFKKKANVVFTTYKNDNTNDTETEILYAKPGLFDKYHIFEFKEYEKDKNGVEIAITDKVAFLKKGEPIKASAHANIENDTSTFCLEDSVGNEINIEYSFKDNAQDALSTILHRAYKID